MTFICIKDYLQGCCVRKISRNWILLLIFAAAVGCDPYPGYEKISGDVWKKLQSFSDCDPDLLEAEYFLMDVSYKKLNQPDSGYRFVLHHHALHATPAAGYSGAPLGKTLSAVLDSMRCGDNTSLILPFSEFDNTWIGAYADSTIYGVDEKMQLHLHLLKTFDRQSYTRYLMQASQQGELLEEEAIELLLMNDVQRNYEKHGKCFIQYIADQAADSILPGREVTIRYNTFLLDGTRLDDTTTMQFPFGRPGQIVGGLQYALSFLGEGDEALIYLPSALAFGAGGSTGMVVPAQTPVYFKLRVENVRKPGEMF